MVNLALKANIAQAEGDLPRAAALLAPLHPSPTTRTLETQIYQAILEGHPRQYPSAKGNTGQPRIPRWATSMATCAFGWAGRQEVAGDYAAAQETWRQARRELELFLKEQPENSYLIANLALTIYGSR